MTNLKELSVSELHQRIKDATDELIAREIEEVSAIVEDGVIEHEGMALRKVDRDVSPGDYVRFYNTKNQSRIINGVIYGPVENSMTINLDNGSYNVINYHHNRTPETVEVFEVVHDFLPQPKTNNQQRAELIQRARAFVEEHFNRNEFGKLLKYHRTVFVVNEEKRTVVALIKTNDANEVVFRGIAKCHPDDVFNADIGKAIALARALEIEIPEEFLDAIQPESINGSDNYG